MNNKAKVKLEKKGSSVKFTEEERKRRGEAYYILIASLNTVRYAIAEIGVDTLAPEQKSVFKSMVTESARLLRTIYGHNNEKIKADILQDISFENVAAFTEVFRNVSRIPPEEIEWFTNEVNKLAFHCYNKSELFK
jgi:hypothetical protein